MAATRNTSKPKATKAATDAPEEKQFRSVDGTDIRVTHPDGSVAIVGADPRPLPRKMWRAAIKAGCQTDGTVRAADLPSGLTAADDAFTRKQAIKDAMIEALQSDEADPAYEDAFTANDIPNVRWLEKKIGFSLSADERDVCWGEVQEEIPDADEDEDGEDDNGDNA